MHAFPMKASIFTRHDSLSLISAVLALHVPEEGQRHVPARRNVTSPALMTLSWGGRQQQDNQ